MSQIIFIYILAKRKKKGKAALREGLNWDMNLDVACADVNSRTTYLGLRNIRLTQSRVSFYILLYKYIYLYIFIESVH